MLAESRGNLRKTNQTETTQNKTKQKKLTSAILINMAEFHFNSVEEALEAVREGKFVLVLVI